MTQPYGSYFAAPAVEWIDRQVICASSCPSVRLTLFLFLMTHGITSLLNQEGDANVWADRGHQLD